VQAVRAPHARIVGHRLHGEIDQERAVTRRRGANDRVQRAHPPRDRERERREREAMRDLGSVNARTAPSNAPCSASRSRPTASASKRGRIRIVHARHHGDEVGAHRDRDVQLPLADLARGVAADREVRVFDRREARGEPVREAAVLRGAALRIRIADPSAVESPIRDEALHARIVARPPSAASARSSSSSGQGQATVTAAVLLSSRHSSTMPLPSP